MARLKFYLNPEEPSNVEAGAIWCNRDTHSVSVYTGGSWIGLSGKVKDITYEDGKLIITKESGSFELDLSESNTSIPVINQTSDSVLIEPNALNK